MISVPYLEIKLGNIVNIPAIHTRGMFLGVKIETNEAAGLPKISPLKFPFEIDADHVGTFAGDNEKKIPLIPGVFSRIRFDVIAVTDSEKYFVSSMVMDVRKLFDGKYTEGIYPFRYSPKFPRRPSDPDVQLCNICSVFGIIIS